MGLVVTLTGDADKYLIRGAVWELGASSYRAYVHLVPSGPRPDLSQSALSIVSVSGQTMEKVLDAAIARVMTTIGTPVQNLQVRAAPRDSEARYAALKPSEAPFRPSAPAEPAGTRSTRPTADT